MLGLGRTRTERAVGPDRLPHLSRIFDDWRKDWRNAESAAPRAFLGFAFDPEQSRHFCGTDWPNAELAWPELLILRENGRTSAVFSAHGPATEEDIERWLELLKEQGAASGEGRAEPCRLSRTAAFPSDREWLARVERLVGSIRAGKLAKAVLTRRIAVESDSEFDVPGVLATLAAQYPACAVYALQRNGVALLGASPERLVSLKEGEVRSEALAGTGGGAAPLIGDAKERHEHDLVVRAILDSLAPCCDGLSSPETPELLELRNVTHLRTPVSGRVRPGVGLFDLAERLHPTPAVGGFPRDTALERIRAEDEPRIGWYSGGLGWIRPGGDGELAVVLRCAAISGRRAELSAGAGIVADSDPARELAETEAKLAAMLNALAEGG